MKIEADSRPVFQGDVGFQRVEARDVPEAVEPVSSVGGKMIVAHSETGHHHYLDAQGVVMLREPSDPLVAYLCVECESADVVHARPFDTHETISLPRGIYRVMRQREYVPGGFRRVED